MVTTLLKKIKKKIAGVYLIFEHVNFLWSF
jgi:hypothetical protein